MRHPRVFTLTIFAPHPVMLVVELNRFAGSESCGVGGLLGLGSQVGRTQCGSNRLARVLEKGAGQNTVTRSRVARGLRFSRRGPATVFDSLRMWGFAAPPDGAVADRFSVSMWCG